MCRAPPAFRRPASPHCSQSIDMDLIVDFPHRQTSGSQKKAPREVSFANHSEMFIVESLACKYKSDLWYSRDELSSFKQRAALLLNKVNSTMSMAQYSQLNAEVTDIFMGLESYLIDSGRSEVKQRRQDICAAVLHEQTWQIFFDRYDPSTIAKISEAESESSRRKAHFIGLLQAKQ